MDRASVSGLIERDTEELRQLLRDLQTKYEVSLVLEETVDRVEQGDRLQNLRDLENDANELEEAFNVERKHWLQEEVDKRAELEALQKLARQKKAENLEVAKRAAEGRVVLDGMEMKEKEFVLQEERRTARSDLTSLPDSVLCSLGQYLEGHDITQILGTCHRWKRALDRGPLWKGVANRRLVSVANEIARRKERESEIRKTPRCLSATITDIKTKKSRAKVSSLPKSYLFKLCQEQLHQQLTQALSFKDDLSHKAKAEASIIKFLQDGLRDVREVLGVHRLEHRELLQKTVEMARQKADIAEEISLAEQEVKDTQAKTEQLRADMERTKKEYITQIQVMQDVSQHADGEENGNHEMQIKELKMQKKVLKKGVRMLQQEAEKLEQETKKLKIKHEKIKKSLDSLNM